MVIELRRAVVQEGLAIKEHKGIFWDDENALHPDWENVHRHVDTNVKI